MRTALFIIDIWLWLLLADRDRHFEAARAAGARVAAHPASRDRRRAGLHRRQPRASASAPMRPSAIGGPDAAEAIFASPPPVAVLAARPRLARGPIAIAAASFDPFGAALRPVSACQPTNMDDPDRPRGNRRDPRAAEIPEMVVLPQADVDARGGATAGSPSAMRATARAGARGWRGRRVIPAAGPLSARQSRLEFITAPA